MAANRSKRNRRLERAHVLDVKLRSHQTRSARWRLARNLAGGALAVVLAAGAAFSAGYWAINRFLFQNEAFALRQIEVRTDGWLPVDQLQRWAGIKAGDNLLAIDLNRVKRDVELVPWVRAVAVERALPNTLKITVQERSPVARVFATQPRPNQTGYDTFLFFLDIDGFVMRPPAGGPRSAIPEILPAITGLRAEELAPGRQVALPQVQSALQLLEQFECSPMFGLVEIAEIDVSAGQTLRVLTRQQNEITFAPDQAELQLRRWRVVHDYGAGSGRGIAALDLSITNNVPVRWAETAPPAPPAQPPPKLIKSRKKHV